MMELVYRARDNISWKVMDKSWACFFNQALITYGLYHAAQAQGRPITTTNRPIIRGGEKRQQKDTGTAVDLSVNYEDYIACVEIF